MSHMGSPINPPPRKYEPPPDDPNETVPILRVPSVDEQAYAMLRKSEESIDRAMGSFLGKIFKMVVGVIAIIIVISLGLGIVISIWTGLIF